MSYAIAGIKFPAVVRSARFGSQGGKRKNAAANLSFMLRSEQFSRKILAGNSSYKTDASPTAIAATRKVLVSGGQLDDSSSAIESSENEELVSNRQVLQEVAGLPDEDETKVDAERTPASSESVSDEIMKEGKHSDKVNKGLEKSEEKQRIIPSPGAGQRIYEIDPLLKDHRAHLDYRYSQYKNMRDMIDKYEGGLDAFSRGYEKFGFTRSATGVTYREWAPGAKSASLIGDFNNWNPNADVMTKNEFGVWEIFLPNNADGSPPIPHGSRVKIRMDTPSGIKDSIPAWIKFSVQAPGEIPYNGIYYDPPDEVLNAPSEAC